MPNSKFETAKSSFTFMTHLLAKEIPKYDCLVESTQRYPEMDPMSMAAFLLLLRSGDELFRVGSQVFRESSLSQGRFMIMLHLFDKITGESIQLTPADLSERACVTRATVSGLLDSLERDGLVQRSRNSENRRMVNVRLTPSGIALLDEMLPKVHRMINSMMACLTEKEMNQLIPILETLTTSLAEQFPAKGSENN